MGKKKKSEAVQEVTFWGTRITDKGTPSELHHPPDHVAERALDGSVQHRYVPGAA